MSDDVVYTLMKCREDVQVRYGKTRKFMRELVHDAGQCMNSKSHDKCEEGFDYQCARLRYLGGNLAALDVVIARMESKHG